MNMTHSILRSFACMTALLLSLVWSAVCSAQTAIEWQTDLEQARELAIRTQKPLLIEYYSDSCGWCKMMVRYVHPNAGIIELMNKEFVSIRVKGDPGKRKAEYGVRGTPATVIVEPQTMKHIKLLSGYMDPHWHQAWLQEATCRVAMQREAPEVMELLVLADAAHEVGQYTQAMDHLHAGLEKQPDNVALLKLLGSVHYRQSQSPEAIAAFSAAIKQEPKNWVLHLERGLAHYQARKFKEALADFTRAQNLTPINSSYIAIQIWHTLVAMRQNEQAQKWITQFISRRSKEDTEFWYFQLTLYMAGKISEENMLAASKRAYRKMHFYRVLAMQNLMNGNREEARKHFQMALKLNQKKIYDYTLVAADLASLTVE